MVSDGNSAHYWIKSEGIFRIKENKVVKLVDFIDSNFNKDTACLNLKNNSLFYIKEYSKCLEIEKINLDDKKIEKLFSMKLKPYNYVDTMIAINAVRINNGEAKHDISLNLI